MKKFYFWVILVLWAYGVTELVSYGGLLFLSKFRHTDYEPVDIVSARHQAYIRRLVEQKTGYITFSPSLGWSVKSNGSSDLYRSNARAVRSDREYEITPPHGVRRVSAFGDSFTHCDEVRNHETWQAIMEGFDTNLEVLNFGVGAFGLDQSYLRYMKEGRQFHSGIVLIGFMTENILRHVNTYRPFYFPKTGLPLTKPRFVVEDRRLALIPNPMKSLDDYNMLLLQPGETLSRIGANDDYYKRRYASSLFDWSPTVRLVRLLVQRGDEEIPDEEEIIIDGHYNEKSEAFRVTTKIFDRFYSEVVENQSTPVILVFPNQSDLIRARQNKQQMYSTLLSYFDSAGYRYIDLIEAFDNAEVEDLFSGHYTPLANSLVAQYLSDYINNMSEE